MPITPDPETLDFDRPDFAINALYKLITVATQHMNETYPNQEHMVFVRVPIIEGDEDLSYQS